MGINGTKSKRHNRKAIYQEITLTPESLGQFLKSQDIILLGESHHSQTILNTQRDIFATTESELLGVEMSISNQAILDSNETHSRVGWGTERVIQRYAKQNSIKMVATDVLHYESRNSLILASSLASLEGGAKGQIHQSYSLALDYLEFVAKEVNCVAMTRKIMADHSDPKEQRDAFLDAFGDQLPRRFKRNLKESVRDYYLEQSSGPLAGLRRAFDQAGDNIREDLAMRNRLKESDPHMATKLAEALQAFRVSSPEANASLAVGAAHLPGVEKALQTKGYEVASVRIINTSDSAQHGKVFVRQSGTSGSPDYVVTVHDTDHPTWDQTTQMNLIETNSANESQKATNLPQSKAQHSR